MTSPTPIPRGGGGEFEGGRYQMSGEAGSLLEIELGRAGVYLDPRALFWRSPGVSLAPWPGSGFLKQIVSGTPGTVLLARGPGRVGLRVGGLERMIALPLGEGESIEVRGRQFLACTEHLSCSYRFVEGAKNLLFGGCACIDTFFARKSGVLWLRGWDEVSEVRLAPGEAIEVEPGSWIYKEPGVRVETVFKQGIALFSPSLAWNRFTGPGRVGLQSAPPRPEVRPTFVHSHDPVPRHPHPRRRRRREPEMGFPRRQPW